MATRSVTARAHVVRVRARPDASAVRDVKRRGRRHHRAATTTLVRDDDGLVLNISRRLTARESRRRVGTRVRRRCVDDASPRRARYRASTRRAHRYRRCRRRRVDRRDGGDGIEKQKKSREKSDKKTTTRDDVTPRQDDRIARVRGRRRVASRATTSHAVRAMDDAMDIS